MATSNSGYPAECNFLHPAYDTFERYIKLENLDDTPFDATGCTFDLLLRDGTGRVRLPLSFRERTATVAGGFCFLALEKAEGVYMPGVFSSSLRVTINGETDTLLAGKFHSSTTADTDDVEEDVIIINTLEWQIKLTILLQPPTDIVEEPTNNAFPYTFPYTLS